MEWYDREIGGYPVKNWMVGILIVLLAGWIFWPSKSDSSYPEDNPPTYSEVEGSEGCTFDCSGHDAGYEWARDNEVCDTEYTDGNSESFDEGVRSWAENNC